MRGWRGPANRRPFFFEFIIFVKVESSVVILSRTWRKNYLGYQSSDFRTWLQTDFSVKNHRRGAMGHQPTGREKLEFLTTALSLVISQLLLRILLFYFLVLKSCRLVQAIPWITRMYGERCLCAEARSPSFCLWDEQYNGQWKMIGEVYHGC